MSTLRESMTTREFGEFRIRVWRQEHEGVCISLSINDTSMDINKAIRKAEYKFSRIAEIARSILALERVNAVEWVDKYGNGEVLYKDWP